MNMLRELTTEELFFVAGGDGDGGDGGYGGGDGGGYNDLAEALGMADPGATGLGGTVAGFVADQFVSSQPPDFLDIVKGYINDFEKAVLGGAGLNVAKDIAAQSMKGGFSLAQVLEAATVGARAGAIAGAGIMAAGLTGIALALEPSPAY